MPKRWLRFWLSTGLLRIIKEVKCDTGCAWNRNIANLTNVGGRHARLSDRKREVAIVESAC
jgi:hypothetical protein